LTRPSPSCSEQKVDLWLTFVRETSAVLDPVLPYIYGHDVTWQSAFIFTRQGSASPSSATSTPRPARRLGAYDEVITYHEAFSAPLLEVLKRFDPAQIALNYSTNDSHADGLTHGLYLLLHELPGQGRPIKTDCLSAERVVGALRGRKTAERDRAHQAGHRHHRTDLPAHL
jgi:hypothetical protein